MLKLILLTLFLISIFFYCFIDFKKEYKGRVKRTIRRIFPYSLKAYIVVFIFLVISFAINILTFADIIIMTNRVKELSVENTKLHDEQEYLKNFLDYYIEKNNPE